MSTLHTVYVNGERVHEGDDLETAVRTWDQHSFTGEVREGGIEVRTWNVNGEMVRDGWILHLSDNGAVYLNPNITA